ncbi:hypothetical protein [Halobacillus mangrovi]|uniref:hypothetical protein n=1 Tax=Halobacillus mangrovi TaxID=402384 RepID=UPI003D99E363
MRKRTLTDEETIKKYQSGERTVSIAEKANVSVRLINQILSKHKVDRRPKGSWRREYKVNEQYFRTWSNNMAYMKTGVHLLIINSKIMRTNLIELH